MKAARAVPALCLCLIARVQKSEKKWTSRPPSTSPYSATLIETDYNHGESNGLQIRLDAASRDGGGWFFMTDLDTGLIISPKPEMRWASPSDLFVTVRTAEIDGQIRRRFGGRGLPSGSLTVRYVADQPMQ